MARRCRIQRGNYPPRGKQALVPLDDLRSAAPWSRRRGASQADPLLLLFVPVSRQRHACQTAAATQEHTLSYLAGVLSAVLTRVRGGSASP